MFGVPKSGTLVTYLEIIGKVSTNTSFLCHIPCELDIIARTCLTYQCSTQCHRICTSQCLSTYVATTLIQILITHSSMSCPFCFRWVAMLAFGEGWHNNHHAFEYSARHGLEWWQLDPTWWVIRGLEAVGLATKVKLPRKEHMEKLAFPSA